MDLKKDLNPNQLSAVMHKEGPLLILAGAGSGKTRVITYRIAHLVQECAVEPWQILAVTFTNKAAGEMRERLTELLNEEGSGDQAPDGKYKDPKGLWALTFHAFGARLLRRHADLLGWGRDFTIYDTDDSKRLGRLVLRELDLDPQLYKVDRMLAAVEKAKRALRGPENSGLKGHERNFYQAYQKHLLRANAFDFSDLIFQPNRLLKRHPDLEARYRGRFRYVLVDEFQDTDKAQYSLLRHLCPPGANLCVVGDDDQSIYRWRGAEVANILDFEQHFPGCQVVKLERNYRSSGNILDAAAAVIARNPVRHDKRLWTEAPAGEPVELRVARDEREEAQYVAQSIAESQRDGLDLSQVALFYRVNAQSRALEEGLRLYAIPYRVVGGVRFYDRAEIRDLLAYLKLIHNPRSDVDLLRILNVPARGLGEKTRQTLISCATDQDCSLLKALHPDVLVGLRKAEQSKALAFGKLIRDMQAQAKDRPAGDVVRMVIERSGYGKALHKQGTLESQGRLENMQELISAAEDFGHGVMDESLTAFLEHVALITDIDLAEVGSSAVTLMTLHAAKGLEFDQVYLTGMEEGLLPHRRSLPNMDGLGPPPDGSVEEERRLCYVGMTRARKSLFLSLARSRSIFGRTELNPSSRFLSDLPSLMPEPARAAGAELTDLGDFDLDDGDDIYLDQSPDHPKPAAGGDEFEVVDYSDEFSQVDPVSAPASWRGKQVEHATFGRGFVRAVEESAHGPKLTVHFDSVGPKTVLANYVRLV